MRDAPGGGPGSLERCEGRVAKVNRLLRIESQAAKRGWYTVDIGELREGQRGLHSQVGEEMIGEDLKDRLGHGCPVCGFETSVSQSLEDVDPYLRGLALIRQGLQQEWHADR